MSPPVPAPRVAVLDASAAGARGWAEPLVRAGFDVQALEGGAEELLDAARTAGWDAVLLDADMADRELLARLHELPDAPEVVLLASFGSALDAVESIRHGAFDCVARPASEEQVLVAVRRAVVQRRLTSENQLLRQRLDRRSSLGGLVSRDPRMCELFAMADSVAATRATVLISGESGTGKSLLARALHGASDRRDGPFVVVNCGALPANLLETELFGHARGSFSGALAERAGRVEAADGGTLFLDEISAASLDLQVKLLRVLQERTFERVGESLSRRSDVRWICATNEDLARAVAEGRFREDLFYRVHVIHLQVPPLRERPGDVALLAEHFLRRLAHDHERPEPTLDPSALARLLAHPWPGNVRQLENALERALLLCRDGRILPDDLGPEFADPDRRSTRVAAAPLEDEVEAILPLKQALEGPERRLIERALRATGGRRQEAARRLGINRTTLFNKMRKYGLLGHAGDPDEDRG